MGIKVLGLHHKYHDSGACLISDDGIVCISEERLNRKKQTDAFPINAINYCMNGMPLDCLDLIVIDKLGIEHESDLRKILSKHFEITKHIPIILLNHHHAHAASAFWVSPFDRAAILIVDGYGSIDSRSDDSFIIEETYSIFKANASEITLVERAVSRPGWSRGIGMAYSDATLRLGFKYGHEGKTMGLSAYAEPPDNMIPLFEENDGNLALRDDHPVMPHVPHYSNPVIWKNGKPERGAVLQATIGGLPARFNMPEVDRKYAQIAAYVQAETEKALSQLAQKVHELTGEENLCIAGGCGLNSVANAKIVSLEIFDNIFIQPAASDAGIPLGTSLWGYHEYFHQPHRFSMGNASLSRPYTKEQILSSLSCSSLHLYDFNGCYERMCRVVAQLLSSGNIIGWFQGSSEFGPRGLGSRSILADPRVSISRDRLNNNIKKRELWRPFAPSVLEEWAEDCFISERKEPYMLSVVSVSAEWRDKIPACLHCDDTARYQTVAKDIFPLFYMLIEEFRKATSIPLVVNTSFNRAGEPIIETPGDAIKCMIESELDWLAIEDFVVTKKKNKDFLNNLTRIIK
jgi:carbamoyltransferase